ncbi:hypothetical protein QJS04_geneDACA013890 [Acorus gramineus]|uniref:Uncharacterized protein n=1 Tax=Acorus gramineus TaxID=55184 RepID=A0AAV9AZU4_ACOGR|nr:hypothetical protein QJS04_geneDACA013890 [Acorus gramineus]
MNEMDPFKMHAIEAQTNSGLTESGSVYIFMARLVRRDSPSTSRSHRKGEAGVPFEWEVKPGITKDPPEVEPLLPLSPPPALQSVQLKRFKHRVKNDSSWLKL